MSALNWSVEERWGAQGDGSDYYRVQPGTQTGFTALCISHSPNALTTSPLGEGDFGTIEEAKAACETDYTTKSASRSP